MEHKGDLHPQIIIEDDRGQMLASLLHAGEGLPRSRAKANGSRPARCWPRRRANSRARRTSPAVCRASPRSSRLAGRATRPSWPRSPARSASARRKRGKRIICVQPDGRRRQAASAKRVEHQVPHGKHLRVHTGDYVKEGDPLVIGPLVPHDILRIRGPKRCRIPGPRGADRLPQPARGHRRQAHRDHRRADAAQGEGRANRRHGLAARGGHGQVRLPRGQRAAGQGVRQDQGSGRLAVRAWQDRQPRKRSRRRTQRLEGAGKKPPTWETPRPATAQTQLAGHHQGGRAVGQLHLARRRSRKRPRC